MERSWGHDAIAGAGALGEEVAAKAALKDFGPTLAEDARVGALRVRQESCRWEPTRASGRSSQMGEDG